MAGETLNGSPEHALKDFEGTYVGISPTDESAIGMGEISITIDGNAVVSRMATGLEEQKEVVGIEETKELSTDEVSELLDDPSQSTGFRVFDIGGLKYMFATDSLTPEDPTLWVIGSMGDLIGPTVLFNPSQVEQGLHEPAFERIETEMDAKGKIPRLNNGGLAPVS